MDTIELSNEFGTVSQRRSLMGDLEIVAMTRSWMATAAFYSEAISVRHVHERTGRFVVRILDLGDQNRRVPPALRFARAIGLRSINLTLRRHAFLELGCRRHRP